MDVNKNSSSDYNYNFNKEISLSGNATEYNQTVERKYLWDLFKNNIWNIGILKSDYGYSGDLS
jgi:hypothetical protein